jgi:hypothetical protein
MKTGGRTNLTPEGTPGLIRHNLYANKCRNKTAPMSTDSEPRISEPEGQTCELATGGLARLDTFVPVFR